MSNNDGLFREKAVKHATSPEQLDQIVKIVSFRGWMVLASFFLLFIAVGLWSVFGRIPATVMAPCILYPMKGGPLPVFSYVTGSVKHVFVMEGQNVQPNQPLMQLLVAGPNADLNSMKDLTILSPNDHPATVLNLYVIRGDWITPGSPLVLLSHVNEHPRLWAYAFVPPQDGKKIVKGMRALIALNQANPDQVGYLKGQVEWVSLYPIDDVSLGHLLRNQTLAQNIVNQEGAPYEVILSLTLDANDPSGYQWTSHRGVSHLIQPGSSGYARIITSEQAPITMIFPWVKQSG